MTKRIAIIGRGTAGSQSILHFLNYASDCEIEWHYDPSVPVQSVDEGSTLPLSNNLYHNFNFSYLDMDKIDSTLKMGVYKSGWGKNKEDFLHQFPPPTVAIHFNAISLQNYIFNKIKNKVKIFEYNVSPEDIDADFVMDCSGKSKEEEKFHNVDFIPVNSAHIVQCNWEYPEFQHTLTIARPYGWVFGVPLQNRCSIGYLYNKNINSLEDVKEDIQNIFSKYDLTPSENVNNLKFNNYYRKQNYTDRVCYNGNASFFLEPMEANSIEIMDFIQRGAIALWDNQISADDMNLIYRRRIMEVETMIMLHYFAGSKYETEFWKFAQQKGKDCINLALKYDDNFYRIIEYTTKIENPSYCENVGLYGHWSASAFNQNISGLGIKELLLNHIRTSRIKISD